MPDLTADELAAETPTDRIVRLALLAGRRGIERDSATQTLWDGYRILGFDTDGDETPAAFIAGSGLNGFCDAMRRAFQQARDDHDESINEAEEHYLEAKRLRGLCERAGVDVEER